MMIPNKTATKQKTKTAMRTRAASYAGCALGLASGVAQGGRWNMIAGLTPRVKRWRGDDRRRWRSGDADGRFEYLIR